MYMCVFFLSFFVAVAMDGSDSIANNNSPLAAAAAAATALWLIAFLHQDIFSHCFFFHLSGKVLGSKHSVVRF